MTKLSNLEENYESRLLDIRREEIKELRRELAIWALTLVLTYVLARNSWSVVKTNVIETGYRLQS